MRTLEQNYDYISNVLKKQNKPLSFTQMYGDGSIFNFDKKTFIVLYTEVLNILGWKIINNFKN